MPLPPSEYLSSVWKPDLFLDKVVFCTGGNGSICSAQVRAFVHLGANACIVGRNKEKTDAVAQDLETARPGCKVLGIGNVDVRNVENLQSPVNECVGVLGGIDFLIAGAAALPAVSGCFGTENNVWSTLPNDKTSGPGGRVIYLSTTNHYTGIPLQSHVVAAKAGIDALSANVAIEYGPLGITSNVIAPGPIAGTEGMDRLSKRHKSGDSSVAAKSIPVGRWGSIKEIADATIFLFSDAANYVTADRLVVDGGAWRIGKEVPGGDFEYPDFLVNGAEASGVGGTKATKDAKL